MRNYDEEIEQLRREIEDLELEKRDKETQIQRILRERKQKISEKKNPNIVDKSGRVILIGNRVIATTTGKFEERSGVVTDIKKWVTFVDTNGVKQVRAPNNLLVQDV